MSHNKKKKARPKMQGEGVVFKYGARAPSHGCDVVRRQLWLAHRYRNKLCELELARREAVHAALADLCPDLFAVEQEIGEPSRAVDHESGTPASPATGIQALIEEAETAVRSKRMTHRNRAPDLGGHRKLSALKKKRNELRKKRRELREGLYASDEWQRQDETLHAAHAVAEKQARADCGLYWGTYLQVENAAKSMMRGTPPRFRPWRMRRDKLAVQFQGGLSVADLLACDDRRARLAICRRPHAKPKSRRGDRVLDGVLSMRIGSDGRDPVWAEIPLRFHRPIPTKARIKWLFLTRRSVGNHDVWSIQFVCEADSWAKPDLATGGSVGVDVGWRRFPDRLRVAVWAGSDGAEGELALPAWWIAESRKVRGIRSERDRLLDGIRAQVLSWASTDDRAWIAQTGSHRRVEQLVHSALQGDADVPEEIVAWRSRERHLHEYEAHLRDQLQGSRRDLYRRFAAMVTRRYATVAMEDLDLREFHVLPPVEDGETARNDVLKVYVRDACLSTFRGVLKHRARKVELVDPAGTTDICHACGQLDEAWRESDEKHILEHECANCSLVWDQDVNAARNILALGDASGPVVSWTRPPFAPDDIMTYPPGAGNKAQRIAELRKALASARANRSEAMV